MSGISSPRDWAHAIGGKVGRALLNKGWRGIADVLSAAVGLVALVYLIALCVILQGAFRLVAAPTKELGRYLRQLTPGPGGHLGFRRSAVTAQHPVSANDP